MFTLFDSISHNYSYAKIRIDFLLLLWYIRTNKKHLPKRINKWKNTLLTKKFQPK